MSKHRVHGPVDTLLSSPEFRGDKYTRHLFRSTEITWCRTCGAWRREVYTAATDEVRVSRWKRPALGGEA